MNNFRIGGLCFKYWASLIWNRQEICPIHASVLGCWQKVFIQNGGCRICPKAVGDDETTTSKRTPLMLDRNEHYVYGIPLSTLNTVHYRIDVSYFRHGSWWKGTHWHRYWKVSFAVDDTSSLSAQLLMDSLWQGMWRDNCCQIAHSVRLGRLAKCYLGKVKV